MDDLKQDLLVAVLAVLTDAMPRANLAAVLKTWSEKCEEPLSGALKTATGLDDERFHALEFLAAAHLKTHQDDLRLSLQALGAQSLTDDMLTEADDGAERTLASPTSEGEATIPMDAEAHGGNELGFTLDPFLRAKASGGTKGERFQLMRPHAQGGIGQVWLAVDSELSREVAVKEIQPRYAGREDQRARFVLEAEITGSLEHPGIVPVYSLGRNAEGRPYYAMRFIRGESLLVALRRFHQSFGDDRTGAATTDATSGDADAAKDEQQEPAAADAGKREAGRSKWGIEFRQLIGRFLDVCDAIDYAHSRGVLHRDLKPANIMLGPYGETLVVDWGLAKKMGTGEPAVRPADGEFDPHAAANTDAGATLPDGTLPGTTIGTPAYMSPEQALGQIDKLGPASDVYSLGATLYELITGKAPFHEKKLSLVISKVIAGDFPHPRAVDRTIPAPLEAICLKAMAKKAEDRYGSVRALAQDLEHWLADEPTEAYSESPVEKLTRWFRQHKAWTFAGAAALVLVSTIAVVAALFIEASRHQEQISRKEAEMNFAMAKQAVDDYLTNVSENTLLKEEDSVDLRTLRSELLNSALKFYERFAAQKKNDPALREELAKAYFRVGQITRDIGSFTAAMSAFRSAQEIWEDLVKAKPENHELVGNLGECFLAMGRLESSNRNYGTALELLDRSRAILSGLRQAEPSVQRYQFLLADCFCETGIARARLDEPEESLPNHENARAIQQSLIDKDPENLTYKKALAENLNALGFAYYQYKIKKPEYGSDAIKTWKEVEGFCEKLLDELSSGTVPTWVLNLLALSQHNIGIIHKENEDFAEALKYFKKSLKHRSELADQHASVTRFREKLGFSYQTIATVQHLAHQDDDAIPSIKRAIDIFTQISRSQPDSASFHRNLGVACNALGNIYDEARNNAAAMEQFARAVEEQRLAVKMNPTDDEYKRELCLHLDNLGEQSVDLGKPADGLPSYREEIDWFRKLWQAHPGDIGCITDLVRAIFTTGAIERHMGDAKAAARSFLDAKTVLVEALRKAPDDFTLELQFTVALEKEGEALADQAQHAKAQELLDQAAGKFRELADRSSIGQDIPLGRLWRAKLLETYGSAKGRTTTEKAVALERAYRSEALWNLAQLLRDVKQQSAAQRIETERKTMWKSIPAEDLIALANLHLTEATLIGFGKTPLPSAAAQAVRELDLDQAASDVALAVDGGCNDINALKSRPEWTLMLSRKDVESATERLSK